MGGGRWDLVAVANRNSTAPEPQGASDERTAELVGQIVRGVLSPRDVCEREGISELELRSWVRTYTRVARRAVDDQVAAALAAHGVDMDELPASEFSGSLGEMAVAELIQTVQFGRKDAHIRVDHGGEQSRMWCVDGDVVDAVSARLSGAAAVYRILSLARGRVHADFVPVQRSRAIHASTQALMLEAAKRSDECAQIQRRLGDTSRVYVPSPSAPPLSEIAADQAEVLRAFDGTRSIEQVMHDSELPDLETLEMIERLLEQQWIVATPLTASQAPRVLAPASVPGSFMPLAASTPGHAGLAPRWRLALSAVAGVAVVGVAFGIGFYSAPRRAIARFVPALSEPALLPACAPGLALLPGGVCLDPAEVSAGQYQTCVRAGVCEPAQRELEPAVEAASAVALDQALPPSVVPPASASPAAPGRNASLAETARCNAGLSGREGYPVNCVTFEQARRYCEWRGGRLPTRHEWEFAATAGGSVAALDLVEGVSEWALEPVSGPAGADGARERYVVMGGGLDRRAGTAGAVSRLYMNASAQGRGVGFRCAVALDMAPTRRSAGE
jgi:hypothetical protein